MCPNSTLAEWDFSKDISGNMICCRTNYKNVFKRTKAFAFIEKKFSFSFTDISATESRHIHEINLKVFKNDVSRSQFLDFYSESLNQRPKTASSIVCLKKIKIVEWKHAVIKLSQLFEPAKKSEQFNSG